LIIESETLSALKIIKDIKSSIKIIMAKLVLFPRLWRLTPQFSPQTMRMVQSGSKFRGIRDIRTSSCPESLKRRDIPSLKLTFSPLKIDP